jgi:hypothetical protein
MVGFPALVHWLNTRVPVPASKQDYISQSALLEEAMQRLRHILPVRHQIREN